MAGSSQRDDEPITSINLTPLVDVSLVLVIIFMAVAPFAIQAGIKVMQSKSNLASQGKTSLTENVQVTLKEDGSLKVNGKTASFAGLFSTLQEALANSKDKMVIITADEKNHVGQVVDVLDTAKQAGAIKLTILKSENAPAPAAPNHHG